MAHFKNTKIKHQILKSITMKKLSILLMITLGITSCKHQAKKEVSEITPITEAEMENAVIYEVNIRQYSEAGTFEAFTKDIPQLKELGVKIIWVMPIFPISETKRKATYPHVLFNKESIIRS